MAGVKAREKKSRTFTFVMFWGDVAWVAGCTDYYYVAQGDTPSSCVGCLEGDLYLTAKFCEMDGHVPFDDTARPDMVVPDEFTDTDSCTTYDPDSTGEDHERRYTGQVTVEWEVPTELEKKHWLAEAKRKGRHG